MARQRGAAAHPWSDTPDGLRRSCGADVAAASPPRLNADVARVSAVPVQMWLAGERSPGADVARVSPGPAQMWLRGDGSTLAGVSLVFVALLAGVSADRLPSGCAVGLHDAAVVGGSDLVATGERGTHV